MAKLYFMLLIFFLKYIVFYCAAGEIILEQCTLAHGDITCFFNSSVHSKVNSPAAVMLLRAGCHQTFNIYSLIRPFLIWSSVSVKLKLYFIFVQLHQSVASHSFITIVKEQSLQSLQKKKCFLQKLFHLFQKSFYDRAGQARYPFF